MGRIGTKSPYAVVEWCDASSAMRAYCWMTLPLSHCVSFAARRLLRLLYGGASLDKVAHTTRSCLVGRGRVVAMVSWRDLLGAICVPSAGLARFRLLVLTLGLRSRNGFLLIDGTVDASSF